MHIPVLLHEVVSGLKLKEGDIFLDATLGRGGHSSQVAKQFGSEVEIIAMDRDLEALERSEEGLRTLSNAVYLKHASFRNLDQVLSGLGIGRVNAILLDLGISSEQIDESGRGFSFKGNEKLSMKMDESDAGPEAKEILNTWSEETLEMILRGFGEERYSKKIAKEIVERRKVKPFETTEDLVKAVEASTPSHYHHGRIHPATRTFQAIRIAVNDELPALEGGLNKAWDALENGGRLAVISFHSLEDRIVKNFMRDRAKEGLANLVTKKPITPSDEEIEKNSRSRSAKLRIIEKI